MAAHNIARLRDERKAARREVKELRREILAAAGEEHGNCEGWCRGHVEGWAEALAFHECPDSLIEEQERLLREASPLAQDGHDAWEEVKTLRRTLAVARARLDSRNGRVVCVAL